MWTGRIEMPVILVRLGRVVAPGRQHVTDDHEPDGGAVVVDHLQLICVSAAGDLVDWHTNRLCHCWRLFWRHDRRVPIPVPGSRSAFGAVTVRRMSTHGRAHSGLPAGGRGTTKGRRAQTDHDRLNDPLGPEASRPGHRAQGRWPAALAYQSQALPLGPCEGLWTVPHGRPILTQRDPWRAFLFRGRLP